MVRAPAQTPREFARTVASILESEQMSGNGEGQPAPATSAEHAIRQDPAQISAALDRIVEAFYRVRFGNLPLDNPEQEAVEHELAELDRSRKASRRRRPGGKAKSS